MIAIANDRTNQNNYLLKTKSEFVSLLFKYGKYNVPKIRDQDPKPSKTCKTYIGYSPITEDAFPDKLQTVRETVTAR